jgi:hypothetical protein
MTKNKDLELTEALTEALTIAFPSTVPSTRHYHPVDGSVDDFPSVNSIVNTKSLPHKGNAPQLTVKSPHAGVCAGAARVRARDVRQTCGCGCVDGHSLQTIQIPKVGRQVSAKKVLCARSPQLPTW